MDMALCICREMRRNVRNFFENWFLPLSLTYSVEIEFSNNFYGTIQYNNAKISPVLSSLCPLYIRRDRLIQLRRALTDFKVPTLLNFNNTLYADWNYY